MHDYTFCTYGIGLCIAEYCFTWKQYGDIHNLHKRCIRSKQDHAAWSLFSFHWGQIRRWFILYHSCFYEFISPQALISVSGGICRQRWICSPAFALGRLRRRWKAPWPGGLFPVSFLWMKYVCEEGNKAFMRLRTPAALAVCEEFFSHLPNLFWGNGVLWWWCFFTKYILNGLRDRLLYRDEY